MSMTSADFGSHIDTGGSDTRPLGESGDGSGMAGPASAFTAPGEDGDFETECCPSGTAKGWPVGNPEWTADNG